MGTEREEAWDCVNRIEKNCKLLFDGYDEEVEYTVQRAYHIETCKWHGKSTVPKAGCECRVENEQRKRKIKRKGYLDQLQDFQANKDTDRQPQAERQAPRVKKIKNNSALNGFFALDEITTDIIREVERVLEDAGRDRTWAAQALRLTLMGLSRQVAQFAESRPDLARHMDRKCEQWVATAKSTLMITTSDSIFDGMVCGNCGGGLASPWGNRGESSVRCVGKPDAGSCGHEYPMSEWLKIFEGQA